MNPLMRRTAGETRSRKGSSSSKSLTGPQRFATAAGRSLDSSISPDRIGDGLQIGPIEPLQEAVGRRHWRGNSEGMTLFRSLKPLTKAFNKVFRQRLGESNTE